MPRGSPYSSTATSAVVAAHVIDGRGAFLIPAEGMHAFAAAILAKRVSEIAQAA